MLAFFALTLLVRVPKLRFSSKYSEVLALPKNYKFPGAPITNLGEKACKSSEKF